MITNCHGEQRAKCVACHRDYLVQSNGISITYQRYKNSKSLKQRYIICFHIFRHICKAQRVRPGPNVDLPPHQTDEGVSNQVVQAHQSFLVKI